jgi:hypothetical protein
MPIEPVREKDVLADKSGMPTPAWKEFFRSIYYALFGWKRSYTALKTFDFPNVAAGGQQTTTVTVTGARQGDAVSVTSKTQVNGLGVYGVVTANDTVTIVRFNYSAAGIDPASDDFRVVVFQQ